MHLNKCAAEWSEAALQERQEDLADALSTQLEIAATGNNIVLQETCAAFQSFFADLEGLSNRNIKFDGTLVSLDIACGIAWR